MRYRKPARTAASRIRSIVLAFSVIVSAAIIGVAASPLDIRPGESGTATDAIDSAPPATKPPATEAPNRREVRGPDALQVPAIPLGDSGDADDPPVDVDTDQAPEEERTRPDDPDGRERGDPQMALGEADGVVPDGVAVSVFDADIPAVANLDPDLLDAVRWAAGDAADVGVMFSVNSGWRSPDYQEQLLREAIVTYGSEEEAARWVATADTSAHVSGDAIDIGPADASTWLSEHGNEYGLCQIYVNEPWHFELRPDAAVDGCPPMYADPTHDPRMQR